MFCHQKKTVAIKPRKCRNKKKTLFKYYFSAEEASIDPFGNVHFLVESSGDVLWVPPAHFKAFCKLNLRYWPFDEQTCTLKFGSWTSHGEQIDLQLYRNFTEVWLFNNIYFIILEIAIYSFFIPGISLK